MVHDEVPASRTCGGRRFRRDFMRNETHRASGTGELGRRLRRPGPVAARDQMLALSRRICARRRMVRRLVSRRHRLHGIGKIRHPWNRELAATAARRAGSKRSRRDGLSGRTRAPRVVARRRHAAPTRRRTCHRLRRPALAEQPRALPPRARMDADARRCASGRVRGVPRRCAGPGSTRRCGSAERAVLHELPSRAERRARVRDLPWRGCARLPATLAMLLPRNDGGSRARRACGAERHARHRAPVLDVSSSAERGPPRRRARQRLRRRVVRFRGCRTRRALRRNEQELHWHVSCSDRRRAPFPVVDRRGTDDVWRLPFVPPTEPLPRPVHDVPSRSKRRRHGPHRAEAARERARRPRRRQRQVRRMPRAGR